MEKEVMEMEEEVRKEEKQQSRNQVLRMSESVGERVALEPLLFSRRDTSFWNVQRGGWRGSSRWTYSQGSLDIFEQVDEIDREELGYQDDQTVSVVRLGLEIVHSSVMTMTITRRRGGWSGNQSSE
jgi:hypothetical protein